jgi:HipA-like protein
MKPIERRLNVFFYDDYVGQLLQVQGGDLAFEYDEAYIEREELAISYALPVQKERFEGKEVKAFFSGILPDEGERERLARQVGVSQKNPFALLNAIGGECAGAISIHSIEESAFVDKSKSPLDALPLDEKAVLDLAQTLSATSATSRRKRLTVVASRRPTKIGDCV